MKQAIIGAAVLAGMAGLLGGASLGPATPPAEAVSQPAQVKSPRPSTSTMANPEATGLARASLSKGDLRLAEYYATLALQQDPLSIEAATIIKQLMLQQANRQLDNMDLTSGVAMRKAFDASRGTLNNLRESLERQTVLLLQSGVADPATTTKLTSMSRETDAAIAGLDERRRASFSKFALDRINACKGLYYAGKSGWYWNDDEGKFKEALVQLMRVGPVLRELGEPDRAAVASWFNTLKAELNGGEYQEVLNTSRISLGSSDEARLLGGAQ